MTIRWRIVAGLVVWGALLYGALLLREVPGNTEGLLCGPWGCTTSLQALASLHAFWLVLLGPPVFWWGRGRSARQLKRLGMWLVVAGLAGGTAVGAWYAITWLPDATPWLRKYFVQKCLLELARLGEVPIVPVTVLGIICWARGKRGGEVRGAGGTGQEASGIGRTGAG